MSLASVLRFTDPVLEGGGRMTDEARRARARHNSSDGQLVPFGEAVDARFAAHGIDPALVKWDAYRREDGQWIVWAGWRGGESARVARWAFSRSSRTVTPTDETAADLLSDRPIRPVVHAVPIHAASVQANATIAGGPVTGPDAVSPDALTGPLPATLADELFDQEAAESFVQQPDYGDSPPLPLRLADPITAPKTSKAAAKNAAKSAPRSPPETEEERASRRGTVLGRHPARGAPQARLTGRCSVVRR